MQDIGSLKNIPPLVGSNLSRKQCDFASKLSLLIQKGEELGYSVKIASYLRSVAEEQAQIDAGKSKLTDPTRSKHVQGLAVDLALFKDDVLTENGKDYLALGMYWELLGGTWGGRWQPIVDGIGFDYDHFQI